MLGDFIWGESETTALSHVFTYQIKQWKFKPCASYLCLYSRNLNTFYYRVFFQEYQSSCQIFFFVCQYLVCFVTETWHKTHWSSSKFLLVVDCAEKSSPTSKPHKGIPCNLSVIKNTFYCSGDDVVVSVSHNYSSRRLASVEIPCRTKNLSFEIFQ